MGEFPYSTPPQKTLDDSVREYFSSETLKNLADSDLVHDNDEKALLVATFAKRRAMATNGLRSGVIPEVGQLQEAEERALATRPQRLANHRNRHILCRIASLEALLRVAERLRVDSGPLHALTNDIRRLRAAPLFARLEGRWPERARELVGAYHDMIAGKPFDEVFSNAFKTVEEIARSLTGDAQFTFSDDDLRRWFPRLHPTIKATISKLRAHRGDEGAHGRNAPDSAAIRYLLFQICNLALLLLESEASKER